MDVSSLVPHYIFISYALRKMSILCYVSQARLMMELNYMLSYGAAKPSLCLLQRFNLLQFLLPHVVSFFDCIINV